MSEKAEDLTVNYSEAGQQLVEELDAAGAINYQIQRRLEESECDGPDSDAAVDQPAAGIHHEHHHLHIDEQIKPALRRGNRLRLPLRHKDNRQQYDTQCADFNIERILHLDSPNESPYPKTHPVNRTVHYCHFLFITILCSSSNASRR